MTRRLYLSIFALFAANVIHISKSQLTRCRVTPSRAVEGDQVTIICEFPRIVSKEAFNVHLFKTTLDRSGQASEDLILTYTKWLDAPARYDYHKDGYRVAGDVHTEMVVVIESVIVDQAGIYSCKLLQESGRNCSLEVTAKTPQTSCSVQPVSVGKNATIICHFNINLLRGHREFQLQRRSKYDVFVGNAVVCIKEKEKSETCNKPLNDCMGLADRQKKIKCHYDPKQYYVDTASVTPTTFAVVVLGMSSQSEGDYVCRPLSVESGDLRPCQLNVAESTTVSSSPTISYSTTTTATTSIKQSDLPNVSSQPDSSGDSPKSTTVEATEHGETKVTDPYMVAGWAVAAVLALFIVAACIFFIRYRRKSQRKSPPKSGQDEESGKQLLHHPPENNSKAMLPNQGSSHQRTPDFGSEEEKAMKERDDSEDEKAVKTRDDNEDEKAVKTRDDSEDEKAVKRRDDNEDEKAVKTRDDNEDEKAVKTRDDNEDEKAVKTREDNKEDIGEEKTVKTKDDSEEENGVKKKEDMWPNQMGPPSFGYIPQVPVRTIHIFERLPSQTEPPQSTPDFGCDDRHRREMTMQWLHSHLTENPAQTDARSGIRSSMSLRLLSQAPRSTENPYPRLTDPQRDIRRSKSLRLPSQAPRSTENPYPRLTDPHRGIRRSEHSSHPSNASLGSFRTADSGRYSGVPSVAGSECEESERIEIVAHMQQESN